MRSEGEYDQVKIALNVCRTELITVTRERDFLRGVGPLPDRTWQEELDDALEHAEIVDRENTRLLTWLHKMAATKCGASCCSDYCACIVSMVASALSGEHP